MRSSSIIIVGGKSKKDSTNVEVVKPNFGIKKLPNLPDVTEKSSMVIHDGSILLCGGKKSQQCLYYDHGTWKIHSSLNKPRYGAAIATTKTATFIFGGGFDEEYSTTYEYLPKGSTIWQMGKTKIPIAIDDASAIPVKSDQEIWLIGGSFSRNVILCFSTKDHTFHELPSKLAVMRAGQRCEIIPNTNKIIITGGIDEEINGFSSTEILDTKDGSTTMASPMNFKRAFHGIGILTINDEDRIVVFGGSVHDYFVEVYNAKMDKWELTEVELKTNYLYVYGFLSTKFNLLAEITKSCNYREVHNQSSLN